VYSPPPGAQDDPTGFGDWRAIAAGVDKGYSDDPRNQHSPRDLADANTMARAAVLGEWARLGLNGPDSGVDTPEQALYGYAPGYGPEVAARQIEAKLGKLDALPGWRNARQFAEAGARRAGEVAERTGNIGDAESEFQKNQWLLPPERLEYMQSGPGRAIDLLDNLRSDPVKAVRFWDKSRDAAREREDIHDPNYQRFSGAGNNAAAFVLSPTSPLAWYLRTQKTIPDAIAFSVGEPDGAASQANATWGPGGDALAKAANLRDFQDHARISGGTPILDLPDDASAQQFAQRLAQLGGMFSGMQPPPDQNAVNSAWEPVFGASAPAAVVDLWSLLRGTADATLPGGLGFGIANRIRSAPQAWAQAALQRAQAGLPIRPYRPVGLVGASLLEGKDQLVPEVAFEAGARHASGMNKERSLLDWLTKPVPSEELDAEKRDAAHRSFEAMRNSAPQSIWNERDKAFRKHVVDKFDNGF
jgi:hypothetical protein